MNILQLPVSPLTKKAILARYGGTEPVFIKTSDPLSNQFTCTKIGDEHKAEKTHATLTATLDVQLSELLAKQANKKRWRIGLQLDDYFREKLNEYIETREESGVGGISDSIRKWCFERSIDIDIDVSYEALYKDYQRHKQEKNKKNDAFFARQKQDFVRNNGRFSTQKLIGLQLFADAELDEIIKTYKTENVALFKTTRGHDRKKLSSQLACYVYRHIGNRPPQYVCRKLKISRTYQTQRANKTIKITDDYRLRRAVRSFKIFLLSAPPLSI